MIGRVLCAYLLWLPPLGWLGLHQCYLGRHFHAIWIFTTFAGFLIGWFRDLWWIRKYAAASAEDLELKNNDAGCCCGIFRRLMQCIKSCLGRSRSRHSQGSTPKNNSRGNDGIGEEIGDFSDDDFYDTYESQAGQIVAVEKTTVEQPLGPKAVVTKEGNYAAKEFNSKSNVIIAQSTHTIGKTTAGQPSEDSRGDYNAKELSNAFQTTLSVATKETTGGQPSQPKLVVDLSGDNNAEEHNSKSNVIQANHSPTVEKTPIMEPLAVVTKIIEDLLKIQLSKELDHHEINQISQVELKSRIKELIKDSLLAPDFKKLLQRENFNEEKIKERLEISVIRLSKKLVEKAKKTVPPPKTADLLLSDTEEGDSDENAKRKKKTHNGSLKRNGSLRVKHNLERIAGVLITARYYRGLVTTAISDYMETGWVIYYLLQSLPLLGMICGVYLVSNIGNPPRLTLRASLISGLVSEALFGVAKILFGTSNHLLTCLVCTLVAVCNWQWPTNSESTKRSNKYSTCAITFCVCVIMMLVWGSIIMNTKIEVDDNEVTISEALHNFYHSPAWSQMQTGFWDTLIMYLEGNWDEASETLLRMSDLSGAERALSVLGLPKNVDEATVKARYKKLAREWHPDKYQGEDKETASNKFIEIQQAYTLLTKRIRA